MLLTIYLFNLAGYSFLFEYLIDHSDKKMEERLDKNEYRDEDLVELKVALHLPYFSRQNDYERYSGAIEIDGKQYNYVKRKVQNDTLFLLCLPNMAKTKLYAGKSHYGIQVNDIPLEKKDHAASKKKGLSFEHDQQLAPLFHFAKTNPFSERRHPLTIDLLTDPALRFDSPPPDPAA